MKFLCDRCKTRYSIGDDRVRGKILKIRCKNCANVITVREGMAEAEAEPSQGGPRRSAKPTTLAPPAQVTAPTNGAKPPAALEEEWYVSIDGEQSGPFSLHEAQKWIGARPVTADLHCWSEGFDDWLPVDKVSHFRGLRKKPAPAPAPPPAPPRAVAIAPQVEEDEPKPLFAATMAAIEKSAAAAAPQPQPSRTTPLGGTSSLPKPASNGTAPHAAIAPRPLPGPSAPVGSTTGPNLRQTGGVPAMKQSGGVPAMKQSGAIPAIPAAAMRQSGGVPAIPSVRGGTGPRPALPATGPRPSLPFDASDGGDANTQIEAPPFGDDARAAAELAARPRNLPSPFSAPTGFAPSATPAPAFTPPPAFPAPAPAAMPPPSLSGTGANGAMAMAFNPEPRALPLAAPPPVMPEPEPEGDIEIGEVSRVVNLADLARNHAATKAAAARKSQPRLRTTGANPSLGADPIAAMVATPDAGYTNGAMVAEPAAPPHSHKKLYLLLGVVVLLLLGGVGAVVYAVTQTGDDQSTAISQGREVDLTRPDDPLHHNGPGDKPDVKDPTVPHPGNTHRPYVPPTGSNKPPIVDPDLTPDTNALKPDEVEAMARTQSEATNRCYMRAQRGADAILVGDVKRINVTITVDKDGVVSTVDLSDHATDSLGKCLQSRIKGWRFHPSNKGLTTRLTLVFQAS